MKNCSLKIAITGGNGQLACALRNNALIQQFEHFFYARNDLDITQMASIESMLTKNKPDVIINAAAYTAVDKAETDRLAAMKTNQSGTAQLAIACQKNQIPLLHISTDYIFDGKKTTPYHEDDEANPINYYGKSKYLSELAVREHCDQHIILRVSGVFSEFGNNFFKTILRIAQEKKQLQIVADQITCPTYAGNIAATLLAIVPQLASKPCFGTYHYCSAKPVSWYQFAKTIVEEMKRNKQLLVEEIKPIPATEYKTAANRPAYSVLDCERIKQHFGIKQPDWEDAIRSIFRDNKDLQ